MFNQIINGSKKRKDTSRAMIKSASPGSLYVNEEMRRDAAKALSLSQEALDFINESSTTSTGNYNQQQLEQAYRISGYLFASLRLVELLLRTVPVAAEKAVGAKWERLPETHPLNMLFAREGGKLLSRMFLFEAVYGNVLVYKQKSRKAVISERMGKPLPYFHQGGISGFHIIPNINWELEEDLSTGEITGFMLSQPDAEVSRYRNRLLRRECVYHNEFDLREPNKGMSLVSRAIHDAVTDAAISRWVAHYFLSGALPLLLIAPEQDDPMNVETADLSRYKESIEKAWLGIYGEYALRAKFTDRRLHVEQVGIEADKVTAPELDKKALNKITAIIGIVADLVVPPEGGSDNARHKFLIHQAWEQAVIPPAQGFLDAYSEDMGLNKAGMRLVVDRRNIPALQSDRGDISQTEVSVWQGGVQTFGETRQRLEQDENDALKSLENFLLIEGKPQSVERILRNDKMPNDALLSSIQGFWDGGVLKRSEVRLMAFNLKPDPGEKDGYKYEVVPDPSAGGFGGPGGAPPPDAPEPEPAPPNDSSPASTPEGGESPEPKEEASESVSTSDGDKAAALETETAATTPNDTSYSPDPVSFDRQGQSSKNPLVPDEIAVTDERTGIDLDVPEFEPDESEDTDLLPAQEAYASIWLGDEVQLERVVEQVQAQFKNLPASWSNIQDMHITLVYAPDVPDDTLQRIVALLPQASNQFAVRLGPVVTFPAHDGRTVLALAVEETDALLDLQQRVYGAFSVYGLEMSAYSAPESWMPHVTLGYLPAGVNVDGFMATFAVMPSCVLLQRDNYETVCRIPLTSNWRSQVDGLAQGWGAIGDPLASENIEVEEQPVNQQTLVDLWDMTLMFREKWVKAIERWEASGNVPRVLPSHIANAVHDTLGAHANRQQVFAAAIQAINTGDFDEDVKLDDNPVLKALEDVPEAGAMQDTALDELAAWERKAMRSIKAARTKFEANRIPLHIEFDINAELQHAENKQQVKAVFAKAVAAYKAEYIPPPTDESILEQVAERMQEIGDKNLLKALDVPEEED